MKNAKNLRKKIQLVDNFELPKSHQKPTAVNGLELKA